MHKSVLLKEVIEGLGVEKGETFVDATLGSAGHSKEILKKLNGEVRIIGIDQDAERIKQAQKIFEAVKIQSRPEIKIIEENFRDIDKALKRLGIEKVDKILFDLGLNSEQLESSGRGFSFQKNEPLSMKFSSKAPFSAAEIVNEWSEESITDILWGYGEERYSRRIAKKIVEARKEARIKTTADLVEIIESAVPNGYKHKKIHFATKTFQALRIVVNDELGALKEGTKKAFELLTPNGRLAIISFHALEDRIVKQYFRGLKDEGRGSLLTKKPITPSEAEVRANPRSRSAKLRIIQKT